MTTRLLTKEVAKAEANNKGEGEDEAGGEEAVQLDVLDVSVDLAALDAVEAVVELLAGVEVLTLLEGRQGRARQAVIVLGNIFC